MGEIQLHKHIRDLVCIWRGTESLPWPCHLWLLGPLPRALYSFQPWFWNRFDLDLLWKTYFQVLTLPLPMDNKFRLKRNESKGIICHVRSLPDRGELFSLLSPGLLEASPLPHPCLKFRLRSVPVHPCLLDSRFFPQHLFSRSPALGHDHVIFSLVNFFPDRIMCNHLRSPNGKITQS